ncbi:MAG: dihydropteroate synthase-like protein [Methanobacteriaceae archaeon]
MKVLVVTGILASPIIENSIAEWRNSKKNASVEEVKEELEIVIHVTNSQIAAFLTPNKIIKELKLKIDSNSLELNDDDIILVPGLIRKSTKDIVDALGIKCFKGPTNGADLSIVLELIGKIELSQEKAADQLIEEEKRKKAFETIAKFESDLELREKLLKKPNNILVKNLAVGEDFPIRVLAEIANAPVLPKEELIRKARYFAENGADMIDIGMVAGENFSDKIPEIIETVRSVIGEKPLSIDTLNPEEIKVAVKCGIDLVLSLDLGNYKELVPLLREKGIPAVLLPTNFREGKFPENISERIEAMEELIEKCGAIDFLADLVLDPINSPSIVDSIIATKKFKSRNEFPVFFGVGNVSELLDADSVGVNGLLAGIGMELGVGVLFTVEESGKTARSVYELAIASKMMFLAKSRNSIPKDLGLDLLVFKDKRKENISVLNTVGEEDISKLEGKSREDVKEKDGEIGNEKIHKIVASECKKFKLDPSGSFKIRIEDEKIKLIHYKKLKADMEIEGRYGKEIYDELVKQGLVSRMEHAAYLGSELQKAEIALATGKNYTQDFELFKKPLDLK